MLYAMLFVLIVGCGESKPVAPEPEPELSELILGEWEFLVPGREMYTAVYEFTEDDYAMTVRTLDGSLVWGETGVWDIIPSDVPLVGTLVLYVVQATDQKWDGQVKRDRLEIRGNFIWLASDGGYRKEIQSAETRL